MHHQKEEYLYVYLSYRMTVDRDQNAYFEKRLKSLWGVHGCTTGAMGSGAGQVLGGVQQAKPWMLLGFWNVVDYGGFGTLYNQIPNIVFYPVFWALAGSHNGIIAFKMQESGDLDNISSNILVLRSINVGFWTQRIRILNT